MIKLFARLFLILLLRFKNLDMAAVAKKELSGQYIGKFQCKIGYGKANATTKIWIGGLGPWCTRQMIEREFDRYLLLCSWLLGSSAPLLPLAPLLSFSTCSSGSVRSPR